MTPPLLPLSSIYRSFVESRWVFRAIAIAILILEWGSVFVLYKLPYRRASTCPSGFVQPLGRVRARSKVSCIQVFSAYAEINPRGSVFCIQDTLSSRARLA